MRLSICHVITTINLGGAERQLLELASSQKRNGSRVEVIFLKDQPALKQAFTDNGVIVNHDFSKLNFIGQLISFRKKMRSTTQVVHAHLPRAELLCALTLRKKRFVVTRHNSEQFFPNGSKYVSRILSRLVLTRAFHSVFISKAVEIYARENRELPKQACTSVIYYGIRDNFVNQVHKKNNKDTSLRIATIARLVPQKNIPLLLDTVKTISQFGISFHLTIVGIGTLSEELQAISLKLGLQDRITWLGQIDKVETVYAEMDIFVLTSNYEGFGLVLLEAMSFGVPVVARRISAIPEVLGDSHPGLVDTGSGQDFARTIMDIGQNRKFRDGCLKIQSEQLSKFSIETSEMSHYKLYVRLQQNER